MILWGETGARKDNNMPSEIDLLGKTIRVTGRVTPEINQKLMDMALELGMQKTAFISLCIRSGLNAVIRSVAPEQLLTEDDWKKILEVSRAMGAGKDGA